MWSWKLTWRWQDFEFSCCTSKMGRLTLTFGNIIFVFRFKYKTTLGTITFVVYILCLWVWIPLRGKDPQREGRINEAKVSQNVFLIHILNGKTKQVTKGCTEDIFVSCEGFLFSHSPWLQFMRTQCKKIFKKLSKFVFKIKSFTISHL